MMSLSNKIRCLFSASLVLFLFSQSFISVSASWLLDSSVNTPVVVNSKRQDVVKIVRDGTGGVYILYVDQVDGGGIYIQRLDENGEQIWGNEKIMIGRTLSWISPPLNMVSDSNGGVIILWEERRDNIVHVYAQRINSDGNLLWDVGGLLVSLDTSLNALYPQAISDGIGGVIVSWTYNSPSATVRVKAQRITNNGLLMWGVDGINLTGFRN